MPSYEVRIEYRVPSHELRNPDNPGPYESAWGVRAESPGSAVARAIAQFEAVERASGVGWRRSIVRVVVMEEAGEGEADTDFAEDDAEAVAAAVHKVDEVDDDDDEDEEDEEDDEEEDEESSEADDASHQGRSVGVLAGPRTRAEAMTLLQYAILVVVSFVVGSLFGFSTVLGVLVGLALGYWFLSPSHDGFWCRYW